MGVLIIESRMGNLNLMIRKNDENDSEDSKKKHFFIFSITVSILTKTTIKT